MTGTTSSTRLTVPTWDDTYYRPTVGGTVPDGEFIPGWVGDWPGTLPTDYFYMHSLSEAVASRIRNEAYEEHAARSAATLVVPNLVESLRARIRALETEQIDGSDPRLANFWQRANEVATESDQCQVYDRMARELGGPGRQHSGVVRVSVMTWISVDDVENYEITEFDIRNAIRENYNVYEESVEAD